MLRRLRTENNQVRTQRMAKPEEFASTLQVEDALGIERLEAATGMARYRVKSLNEYSRCQTLAITTAVDLALVRAASTSINHETEEMNGTVEYNVSYFKTPIGESIVTANVSGRGAHIAVVEVSISDTNQTVFGLGRGTYSVIAKKKL
jgi:acyl-coenzyme A thioesterase PaaI-like protein